MHASKLHQGSILLAAAILLMGGCASLRDYVGNGFKVGPNYCRPDAPVAPDWIDSADARVNGGPRDLRCWWWVFQDPTLDALVSDAVQQNLTLRQAGLRVLQARAARAMAAGSLFPQQQDAFGAYSRNGMSRSTATTRQLPQQFFDQWDAGFNLAWELDFWGRFRRAVEAADADLDASVENYDQVLVTLLADIASTYIEIRTLEQRIALAQQNVELQRKTYTIADARFRGGQTSGLDVDHATSTLAQTEAMIPQLELQRREAANRLCTLLGAPPADLATALGRGPVPAAPAEVAVGIPADLLRRRPDIRRAEREVAAQSARVGIATSELYPHVAITGSVGCSAEQFGDLFAARAFQGGIGPSFQWNILNYGRLLSNIRVQDAKLAELIVAYQNTVLEANAEAENGIARFLRARQRSQWLTTSVTASHKAANIALAQYRGGVISFVWVALIEQNLVQQQDLLAQAQGEIALGLVETYRALGGGWQIPRDRLPGSVATAGAAARLATEAPGENAGQTGVSQPPLVGG